MDFPIVREKKMGTTTGTRVLCTQYLLRVANYNTKVTQPSNHTALVLRKKKRIRDLDL